MQYNILIQGKDFSDCPIAQALVKIPYWVTQKLPQIYTANHLPNTDTKNLSTDLGLFLPYVQEVVNPIYIVTHYINWSNYFLDAQ